MAASSDGSTVSIRCDFSHLGGCCGKSNHYTNNKVDQIDNKHVIQYKTNTHPDKPMHTSLCFDLWTPTSVSAHPLSQDQRLKQKKDADI
jgi:hypothetical protein